MAVAEHTDAQRREVGQVAAVAATKALRSCGVTEEEARSILADRDELRKRLEVVIMAVINGYGRQASRKSAA